jgi:hypothetical protein
VNVTVLLRSGNVPCFFFFSLGQRNWLGLKSMHVIVKYIICRTFISKTSFVLHLSDIFLSFRDTGRVEQADEYYELYMD